MVVMHEVEDGFPILILLLIFLVIVFIDNIFVVNVIVIVANVKRGVSGGGA